MLLKFLQPAPGEKILDAGCGTGVFTPDILISGSIVMGIDTSLPMLLRAGEKTGSLPFRPVTADILNLPFKGNSFDKTISVTALEFISDGKKAVGEMFRVTRTGGTIVVATLNSLSPWAGRRKEEAEKGHTLFQKVIFRSPEELSSLAPIQGEIGTAVHFVKEDEPERAAALEAHGNNKGLNTGAFLAGRWVKS